MNRKIKEKCKISLYTKALCIYLIFLPLGAMHLSDALGSLLKYIALLPVLVWILSKRTRGLIPKRFIEQYLWVGLICLSIVWSVNNSESINRAITNIMFLCLFVSAVSGKYSVDEVFTIKKVLVWSSRLTAIITLVFSSYIEGRLYLSGKIAEDPNYLCAYFLFGIVYILERLLYSKNSLIKTSAYAIELCVYLYIVLYTGSRGGLLSVATAVAFILLFNKQQKSSKKKILMIGIVYIVLIVAINFIPESVANRFSLRTITESNGTGRYEIWKNAFSVYKESNVFRQLVGYGTGTIRNVFIMFGYRGRVVHNIFIETLLENGALGLIAYTAVILKYITTSFKCRDYFAAAVVVGIAVLSLSTSIYSFKPYWNIMIYIGCVYLCWNNANSTNDPLNSRIVG